VNRDLRENVYGFMGNKMMVGFKGRNIEYFTANSLPSRNNKSKIKKCISF
jgi:hypothetical protein